MSNIPEIDTKTEMVKYLESQLITLAELSWLSSKLSWGESEKINEIFKGAICEIKKEIDVN